MSTLGKGLLTVWLTHVLVLIIGLIVLAIGGESLVRGATRLARRLGVSELVVGLTVVAFGTSAPEAAVTIYAALEGTADLAVGNIVGSNISNLLLILGLAVMVRPLRVSRSLIRVDGPVMLLSALLFWGLAALNGHIDRWNGVVFVAGLVGYTALTYYVAGKTPYELPKEEPPPSRGGTATLVGPVLVIVGVGGLVLGARLVVSGAGGLALLLGVSHRVIGLTIVAVGTSLPELATAIIAARRRQADLAVGNIVGSNIFNIFFVAGTTASISPLSVSSEIIQLDGPVMIVASVLFIPLAYSGRLLSRWEGGLLLFAYGGYLAWNATHPF